MSLFVFNNQQKLIKSIPNRDLISVVQDQAINVSDTLFVELPADIWSNLKEPASYLAVQDPYERFSYHMYKVSKHTTKADIVEIEAIQIGYDELKAYGYIKDRRFNNRPVLEAATAVVSGTDWQLGYVDTNLPNVNTNFYYISRLEALSKLIEATGAEVRFRIEISGNKIIAKRMDLYKKLGTFKGKRFAYGSNLLEIVKEEDTSELYTALVGRGKGEETDTGGFGRRITFADIAWSKASGKPADKPLGQEFIELPEMTAYYGYPDGEPRTGIVEFGDIEEPELLLKATYERLIEISRPQVQFKAKVQATGDMQLGEEVAIIRSDLGFRYKTRVFRVKRDYLNNMFTEVELGDKLTESLASRIKKIDTTNARREETIIQYIQTAANGKNKIFRGPIEPTEGMMVNDLWYKPVGEGETMLYTWNGEIWELSKVSAGLLAGTLDAENGDVNLINLNASAIVTGTLSSIRIQNDFARTGGITGSIVIDSDIRMSATDGSGFLLSERRLSFSDGDYETILKKDGLDFYRGGVKQLGQRFFTYEDGTSGIRFETRHVGEKSLSIRGNQLLSHDGIGGRDEESHLYLSPGGTGMVVSGDATGARAPIRARQFLLNRGVGLATYDTGTANMRLFSEGFIWHWGTSPDTHNPMFRMDSDAFRMYKNLDMAGNSVIGESDVRLKKDVETATENMVNEIRKWRFINFEWDKTNPHNVSKPDGRYFGMQAQYAPAIQIKQESSDSYLSIDKLKQLDVVSKAVQEIIFGMDDIKNRLEMLE